MRLKCGEIALKYCKDYPDIETVDSYERLYAIECSLKGCNLANQDLHSGLKVLGLKCGLIGKDLVDFLEDIIRHREKGEVS